MNGSTLRLLVGLAVGGAIVLAAICLARYHGAELVTGLGSHSAEPIAEQPLTVAESLSATSQPIGADQTASSPAPQLAGIDSGPLEHSARAKRDDSNGLPHEGDIADPFVDDPNSVIGRPFPVSESVISQCRPDEGVGPPSCKKILELLARMAEEPRDLRWARETEASLHEWLSQFPDTTIRAIECRTSLCAIETSSINGVQRGPPYEHPLSERLLTWIALWARETDASSARVTVTLQVLQRRYTPKPRR